MANFPQGSIDTIRSLPKMALPYLLVSVTVVKVSYLRRRRTISYYESWRFRLSYNVVWNSVFKRPFTWELCHIV